MLSFKFRDQTNIFYTHCFKSKSVAIMTSESTEAPLSLDFGPQEGTSRPNKRRRMEDTQSTLTDVSESVTILETRMAALEKIVEDTNRKVTQILAILASSSTIGRPVVPKKSIFS